MPRFRNVSPLGDLDIPSLGLSVKAGEVLETTDPVVVESFDQQIGTWERVLTAAEQRAAEKAAAEAAAAEAAAQDSTTEVEPTA